jgi:hypothetical protein
VTEKNVHLRSNRTLHLASSLLALGVAACGAEQAPLPGERVAAAEAAETDEVLAQLATISGLTVVSERPSKIPGARFFVVTFEQPVDHEDPQGPHFTQKIALLHRSFEAPTVLFTGGYAVGTLRVSQNEPTSLLQANQLYVEHRYFGDSVPEDPSFEHLDIEQAAGDHHRIVQAFKAIYPGRWISTGNSKGGMASVYHRYHYPDDVDGTVAYVAPTSYSPSDPRYIPFIHHVGDKACRAKLLAYQRAMLARREQLVPKMVADSLDTYGITFDVLGADRAFEFGVLETAFYFWQSAPPGACETDVPLPDASDEDMLYFFDILLGVPFNFGDDMPRDWGPYFYQAATQLGAPRYDELALLDLLRYPGQDRPATFSPVPVTVPFEYGLMARIKARMKAHGERILFIYGENDPWGTNRFDGRASNDAFQFVVPGANHGARIAGLPEDERLQALDRLFDWADVPFDPTLARTAAPPAPGTEEDEGEGPLWRLPPR